MTKEQQIIRSLKEGIKRDAAQDNDSLPKASASFDKKSLLKKMKGVAAVLKKEDEYSNDRELFTRHREQAHSS